MMGNSLSNPYPAPFPGFTNSQLYNTFTAALAGGGGTADLPGPDAGYTHRIYDQLTIVSNAVGAGLSSISGTYLPSALVAFFGSSGTSNISPNNPILDSGESFRVTNGGANAGRVFAAYFDVNMPSWTTVRQALTATPVTIIPAPAAGLVSRLVMLPNSTTSRSLNPRLNQYNADSIAHSVELLLGGVLVSRSASIAAAATNIAFPIALNVTAGTGALQAQTAAAVSTTSPNLFAVYETL